MNTHTNKTQENKSQSVANGGFHVQSSDESAFQFVDNRTETVAQRRLQSQVNNQQVFTQKKENNINQQTNRSENKLVYQRVLGKPRGSFSSGLAMEIGSYVANLNSAVERAYNLLVSLAFLKIKPVDGYMERFLQDWIKWTDASSGKPNGSLADNEVGLMFARAGYWIESFATLVLKPDVPVGLTVAFQIPMGSTRPDVVLFQGDNVVSLLDITATGSVGHIDAKNSGIWGGKEGVYVNEIMYPSIDFTPMRINHQKGILPSPDDDIDALLSDYNTSKDEGRIRHANFMGVIAEIGKTVQESTEPLPKSRRGPRRDLMRDAIRLHFGVEYTPAQVGSILTYGGVSRETYGLTTGKASSQVGEFLLKDKSAGGNFGNGRDAVLKALSMYSGEESIEEEEVEEGEGDETPLVNGKMEE